VLGAVDTRCYACTAADRDRRAKGPSCHDQVARESRAQDHLHCEPRQRPYTAHYHHRRQPIPLPDRCQPQICLRKRLATAYRTLLEHEPGAVHLRLYISYVRPCEEVEVQHRLEMTIQKRRKSNGVHSSTHPCTVLAMSSKTLPSARFAFTCTSRISLVRLSFLLHCSAYTRYPHFQMKFSYSHLQGDVTHPLINMSIFSWPSA
jgi:hypothetical protein